MEVWDENMRQIGMREAEEKHLPPPEDLPEAMSDERQEQIAAEALGVNYRVGLRELRATGNWTDRAVGDVLGVLIDVDGLVELMRAYAAKKADAPAQDS